MRIRLIAYTLFCISFAVGSMVCLPTGCAVMSPTSNNRSTQETPVVVEPTTTIEGPVGGDVDVSQLTIVHNELASIQNDMGLLKTAIQGATNQSVISAVVVVVMLGLWTWNFRYMRDKPRHEKANGNSFSMPHWAQRLSENLLSEKRLASLEEDGEPK